MAKALIWCNLCLCLSNACPPLPLHLSVRALRGQSAPWVINLRQGIHGGAIQILISSTRGYLGPGKGARAETHTRTQIECSNSDHVTNGSPSHVHIYHPLQQHSYFHQSARLVLTEVTCYSAACTLWRQKQTTLLTLHCVAVWHSRKYLNGHIQILGRWLFFYFVWK